MPDAKDTSAKSGTAKPVPAKPVPAKPAPRKPTATKPAPKPAASKPVPAKPATAAKPTATKPAGAKSAGPARNAAGTAGPTGGTPARTAPRTAATAATATAARTASTGAATEANPLHKRLRLRAEDKGLVIAPPPDADNPLLPLPKGFVAVDEPSQGASQKGPFDYIHLFARDRVELAETLSLLSQSLAPGGSLWISWMKPSSKLKGGGQPGDLNETIVRRIGLTRGFVDLNLASLDRDWSALRLVRRK